MHKFSRYNYFTEFSDKVIGYNFLRQTIVSLPKSFKENLECYSESYFDKECFNNHFKIGNNGFKSLIDTGFIIQKKFEELSYVKYKYNKKMYDKSTLRLVILPSFLCNFQCPYCYQSERPEVISDEIIENLMLWIKSLKDIKRIHIEWFGGEPLLQQNTIFKINELITSYCESADITYLSSLVTNGFLLNEQFLEDKDLLGLKNIQVTIDGDKAFHDNYRKNKAGKETFEIIKNNLILLCNKYLENISLTIRVNCSDNNYESVKTLIANYPESIKSKSTVYFKWIFPSETKDKKVFSKELEGTSPYSKLSSLYVFAQKNGWEIMNPSEKNKWNYCNADKLNFYVINPDGNIFLCTHFMDKEYSIGNLKNGVKLATEKSCLIYDWFSKNPFDHEKCNDCILLPNCYGGCRRALISGKPICIDEKYSIDKFVKNILLSKNIINIKPYDYE